MSTKKETSPSNSGNGSTSLKSDEKLSDLRASFGSQQHCLLNSQKTTAQTSLSTNSNDNVDSNYSTPNSSQQNSPTKSTPSKSAKNKRKNDARKRNANLKKQQKTGSSGSDKKTDANVVVEKALPSSNIKPQKLSEDISSQAHDSHKDDSVKVIKDNSSTEHCTSANSMEEKFDSSLDNTELSKKETLTSEINAKQEHVIVEGKTKTINNGSSHGVSPSDKITVDRHIWNKRQHENHELKEHLKNRNEQLQRFSEKVKQQSMKINELETSLVNTTKTCNQFEKLVQQELSARARLENENEKLNQALTRLKHQIGVFEKDKAMSSELIRTLNATLMERETEVSILKLKMTRLQTSQPPKDNAAISSLSKLNTASSSTSMNRQYDPVKAYANSGRSNSEFSRNSYARSSLIAELAANTRSSATQLQHQSIDDKDASVWAKVPEELTPSKRPSLLDRGMPSIYGDSSQNILNGSLSSMKRQQQMSSTPLSRDFRRYQTLPRSMKSPEVFNSEQTTAINDAVSPRSAKSNAQSIVNNQEQQSNPCLITNLDDSNSTNQDGSGNKTVDTIADSNENSKHPNESNIKSTDVLHYCTISSSNMGANKDAFQISGEPDLPKHQPPSLPGRSPSTPVKISSGLKKIFNVFRRSDSSSESEPRNKSEMHIPPLVVPTTPSLGPFQRGSNRSTLVGLPGNARCTAPKRDFRTDEPFAKWNTDMLVDWLTTIGLSMYANNCRRWVKCGAHIMNATPAEVDKGLGITNHLHRKKLRLAISELNGDCDKITKAASKLDYLWVARWLDDIGLPQYKEAFINARVDGRVLNYLTVEDLFSMGVKSVLHHSSIKCGIKVLRLINFDLQLLKRRATAEEVEQMSSIRQRVDDASAASMKQDNSAEIVSTEASDVPLWTCHRVMEWLRMIDFAEFAPNLRGSGVHGGLIVYEDGFTIDTISSLLGIPSSRTLLRRHLATFFDNLIGRDLVQRKNRYKMVSTNEILDPKTNFKSPKKSPLWFGKLKSSKVGRDEMDEYLCPMYPVEPSMVTSPTKRRADGSSSTREGCSQLPRIPESINV